MVRIWETITGRPHRKDVSRRVAIAAEELTKESRELSSRLRPYIEKDDPLVALMTDILNQRTMRAIHDSNERSIRGP